MSQQLAYNTKGWKIRTQSGFVPFVGISTMGHQQVSKVNCTDGTEIEATSSHRFFTSRGKEITVNKLQPGTELIGIQNKIVQSIEQSVVDQTYDVIESATHTFFANGILSHNCEFLSSDPMLIDTIVVANLQTAVKKIKPIGTVGEITFYKQPQSGTTYLVGMDVATGTGKDFTTLEVFEFPSLEHVAEWRSNTTSSAVAYQTLTKLLRVLERTHSTVFFSVENNGVGEGIIALYEADENPPMASEFVSEEGANRSGMTTTGKSKMRACLTFKELVERGTIHISSPLLIEEMKHFVRKGGTYDHKVNATSDLIMASLIVMRILENVASFDGEAYDLLYSAAYQGARSEDGEYDDDDTPMEMII